VITTTYTQARAHLATLLDKVTYDRETVIIRRRGKGDVALIGADELAGLLETVYLLRSPANAARLLNAIERAKAGVDAPSTPEELRREFGLVDN
jgi:antitoxin YefM